MLSRLARVLGAFLRLGRPVFLVGGFVFYGLGAAAAAAGGAGVDWMRYLRGQLAVTAIQFMTQYANEYFDLAADRANATPTRWSGGSRVLVAGELSPAVALAAALVLAAAAVVLSVSLAGAGAGGSTAALLLLGALGLAWAYSAPPLRLHSRGLGELVTAVVMTGLIPLAGFVLQAGALSAAAVLPILPIAGLQFAMLLAIEFPDAAADAATGKRTLVVRLGAAPAAVLYQSVLIGSFAGLPLLVFSGLPRAAGVAGLVLAPVALWQVVRVRRGLWRRPDGWESLGFWSVALLVATAAAELIAFAWLASIPVRSVQP